MWPCPTDGSWWQSHGVWPENSQLTLDCSGPHFCFLSRCGSPQTLWYDFGSWLVRRAQSHVGALGKKDYETHCWWKERYLAGLKSWCGAVFCCNKQVPQRVAQQAGYYSLHPVEIGPLILYHVPRYNASCYHCRPWSDSIGGPDVATVWWHISNSNFSTSTQTLWS